jgi:GT2 family glycosyltransferase
MAAKHARGIFLARQDADDESLPERLELQVSFMKSHPDFVLLATSYSIKFSSGKSKSYFISLDNDRCIQELFLSNPICHSSAIFRKDAYVFCGGYDQRFYTTQDLDLWFRITKLGKVGFLPEVLVQRNILSSSISVTRLVFLQVYNSTRIRLREMRRCNRRFCSFLIIYSSLRHLLSISILVFGGSRK